LTKGDEPIGNGIGPALEIKDILKVFRRDKDRPLDLEDKSVFLAGQLLEMTGKAKKDGGIKLAKQILDSGKAFEKFKEIIKAQSGNINKIGSAKFRKDILMKNNGKISEIDNKKITLLARIAGSPIDKSAGLYLYKHVGNEVNQRTSF
jgi:thymidine phosphorylase